MFVCVSFRKRAPYIAYLTRCRQGLQTSQAHLERLLQRVLRDKEVANRYFTTVCVRLLLEHMESKMLDFIKGISQFLHQSWVSPPISWISSISTSFSIDSVKDILVTIPFLLKYERNSERTNCLNCARISLTWCIIKNLNDYIENLIKWLQTFWDKLMEYCYDLALDY